MTIPTADPVPPVGKKSHHRHPSFMRGIEAEKNLSVVATIMAENDLQGWWNGLPVVTKWLFASSFGTTVAAHFGLFPFQYLILIFEEVFYKFQVRIKISVFRPMFGIEI
jgi:hypothetical protein